jgi:hypothetical protein
MTDCLF